jgi:hypothetical protein
MEHFDIFPYVWLTGVVVMGATSLACAVNDMKVGSARMGYWRGARVKRNEEPFEFWVAVGSKFFASIMACFMFYMGLDMFNW